MHARRAFTLVELLTVIAIVGVLAGLLIPVLGAVRAKARATECLSNTRQVGVASLLYVADHRGRLPSISHHRDGGVSLSWSRTLESYLGPDFIGRCPGRPDHLADVTYGWNDLLVTPRGEGLPLSACRTPAATLLLLEVPDDYTSEHIHFTSAARGVTPAYFRANVAAEAHGPASNYVFVDGHAASLRWPEIQGRLSGSRPVLVYP
jgi:prepilin-type N-terminal cleavage/methylation domain-containing protein/prepilin-type processing-associated H-X9-DG protein